MAYKSSNGRDYTGPSLSLTGLRKTFGDVVAVDHLDLEVMRGECFGLLGPNGAGKTTTIEICQGLTPSDAGNVTLLGFSWKTAAKELISQLEEKRSARVGGLSGGQKQRLAMACALVGDPELLFLDEPTTGLDPQARRHLWDLVDELKSAGRTIILTTHYMDEAERLCDRVAILDHGRIIALGTPQQLIASTGGDHIVEFAVTNADATRGQIDPEALKEIPGVESHRVDAGVHQLSVRDLHTTVPRIFSTLTRMGLQLSEFRTHSASLEDVFVGLTGRNLRDE